MCYANLNYGRSRTMTRVLPFIVILFCLFAGRPHNACAGTSVLATDNCTRIDNVDLGGAWDPNIATFKISGNLCMGAGDGTDAVERNNSVAWPADQYAKTTFGVVPTTVSGTGYGVGRRWDTTGTVVHCPRYPSKDVAPSSPRPLLTLLTSHNEVE